MPTYEEIKSEIIELAEVLKKYPEPLQGKVFNILISKFLGNNVNINLDSVESSLEEEVNEPETEKIKGNQPKAKKQSTPKKSTPKDSFQIIKDLDLKGINGKESFVDFYKTKAPKTNIEFNVVAIYYLSKIMDIPSVNIDHVYTCYKEAGKKIPGNLRQSLGDTSSSKYGYINSKDNNFTIPVRGENLIEHDLPKTKQETK